MHSTSTMHSVRPAIFSSLKVDFPLVFIPPSLRCKALLMRVLPTVIFLVAALSAKAAPADSCETQIPKALASAISGNFPGFRAPRETDNLQEDVKFDKSRGGKGCLGVAIADFDGDGKKDILLGLTALSGPTGLAVIALTRKSGWQFQQIKSWTEGARLRQYVSAVKPGNYLRTEAIDAPLEEGERGSMQCRYAGALVGATEATGIVYCYINSKWLYVWVSD